jgi:hypothetical protein
MLSPKDNVASVMEEVSPSEEVVVQGGNETRLLHAVEKIPFGFKAATADIRQGDTVFKYGEVIDRPTNGHGGHWAWALDLDIGIKRKIK